VGPCTLTGLTIGETCDNSDAFQVSAACATRLSWCQGEGCRRQYRRSRHYVRDFGAKIPGARPSMLLDHMAGRMSEIDAITARQPVWVPKPASKLQSTPPSSPWSGLAKLRLSPCSGSLLLVRMAARSNVRQPEPQTTYFVNGDAALVISYGLQYVARRGASLGAMHLAEQSRRDAKAALEGVIQASRGKPHFGGYGLKRQVLIEEASRGLKADRFDELSRGAFPVAVTNLRIEAPLRQDLRGAARAGTSNGSSQMCFHPLGQLLERVFQPEFALAEGG